MYLRFHHIYLSVVLTIGNPAFSYIEDNVLKLGQLPYHMCLKEKVVVSKLIALFFYFSY